MLVVADEWLFFHQNVVGVLIPVINNGAVFMAISSIAGDPDSPLMQVLRAQYKDGTPACRILNWIEACKDCERAGTQESCTHRYQAPQHFGSHHGRERSEALMSGDKEAYERENNNVMSKPLLEAAFRPEWIDALCDAKNAYNSHRTVYQLYVTIDPSAATGRNLYVLTSCIFIDGQMVVRFLLLLLLLLSLAMVVVIMTVAMAVARSCTVGNTRASTGLRTRPAVSMKGVAGAVLRPVRVPRP